MRFTATIIVPCLSIIGMSIADQVGAQEVTPPLLAQTQPSHAATTAGNAGAGTSVVTLAPIIVTAQRRAQNVQNVPIAINTIGAEALAANAPTLSTVSLQQFVPGLVMGNSGLAGATFLRGVGTAAGTAGTESPVATYLDGVYLGINALGVFPLNDVAQVQVLKGPQGTLFGRNANGGAILISTKDPDLHRSEGKVEVGYGNYQTSVVRAYGSVPFTDTLAANLSVSYQDRNQGTVKNLFTGSNLEDPGTLSAQGKLLWQPSDRTHAELDVMYYHGTHLPGLDYFVQKGAISQDGKTTWVGPHAINLFTDSRDDTYSTITGLTVSHDFSWARLTNIVGNVDYSNRSFNDQAMTTGLPNPGNVSPSNANLDADIYEWSDDLNLQSLPGASIKWIVGLFYFNDRTNTHLEAFRYPGMIESYALNSYLTTHSYAAYAQATKAILPKTDLTLGVRYTKDDKAISGRTLYGQTVSPSLPPQATFEKPTWRVALDHHFTDEVMGYVSYNRGFTAGAYSTTSLSNPPVKPETLDAYEVGVKSELADQRLRLNASSFYYDYKNMQIRVNVGQPIVSLLENAASAEIYGLDFDFQARPISSVQLYGGFEVLHAVYTSFPNGIGNYPVGVAQLGLQPITVAPPGCTGTPRQGAGGTSSTLKCDLTGNEIMNAPKFSATLGVAYTVPSAIGDWTLSLSDKYTGKSYASPDDRQVLDAYHFVAASLGWASPSDRYYGKLWGTNLGNSGRPAQEAFSLNTFEFLPNDPRFYGITLGMRF